MSAIPGLGSIPGLNLSALDPLAPAAPTSRTVTLGPQSEWRFHTPFIATPPLTLKLLTGTAEIFGTELAPATTYTFRGTNAALFTWHGCQIEVAGEGETEAGRVVGVEETVGMNVAAHVHFNLEDMRNEGRSPRVLVVGGSNTGKSSLVKILTAYAVKQSRTPVIVNLDPREGMLSVPGSLSAAAVGSMLDVEEGWGSSPVSGPTISQVKMPLVYQYGCSTPEENPGVWKALSSRLAGAVKRRGEEDEGVKKSGVIIDTPGSIANGQAGGYELIQHVISEFNVDVLLVIGDEALHEELTKHVDPSIITVSVDKSSGVVDRDEGYMQELRQNQIREYFFGFGAVNLAPHTLLVEYSHLSIYKIVPAATAAAVGVAPAEKPSTGLPGLAEEDEDDDYEPSFSLPTSAPQSGSSQPALEKVLPSNQMQNSLLAITFENPNAPLDQIQESAVMGYVYVAEVDEAKRRVKVLSPAGGAVPRNAMVWGSWPESVVSLVS
jgi:polyribonucleotide 5'-hydroxyl-kinase